jgi:hypothetical protein
LRKIFGAQKLSKKKKVKFPMGKYRVLRLGMGKPGKKKFF